MHPLVRDLYKKILTVGRDYPSGLTEVRRMAKERFRKRKDVKGAYGHFQSDVPLGDDLKKAVHYGRYMLKEMVGVVQLKKFRALKQRYYDHS